MTTVIAVRDKALYSDSQCTTSMSSEPNFQTRKLFRVAPYVIGGCGSILSLMKFAEWMKGERTKPHKLKSFCALVMSEKEGLWLFDEDALGFELLDDRYAIGSGATAAMAAMACGKSPEQALLIAAQLDPCTGGKTQKLLLRTT